MAKTKKIQGHLRFAIVIAILGCGQAKEEDAKVESLRAASISADVIPGFVQQSSRSLVDVSGGVERSADGVSSVTKDGATFVLRSNGWSSALLSAEAKQTHSAYRGSAEEHNRATLELLQRTGIPADQIGAAGASVKMRLPAASEEDAKNGNVPSSEFAGYVTRAQRQVDGVLVPDSFAIVGLDSNGQAVTELIFWPAIPRSVVDEARALQERLSRADEREAYLGQLGFGSERPGKVVVRHSPAAYGGPFEAYAVYDVEGEGAQPEQHYDPNARQVVLQSESADAYGSVEDPRSSGWSDDSACRILDSEWRLPAIADSLILVTGDGRWVYTRANIRMEGTVASLNDSLVGISDDRATGVEACPTGSQGSYRPLWRAQCQELQLVAVDDGCAGRRQALNGLAVVRVR